MKSANFRKNTEVTVSEIGEFGTIVGPLKELLFPEFELSVTSG